MPPILLLLPLTAGVPRAADLADHLGTTAQVLEQLRQGTLYPRWMAEFHGGWGEPTLVFYPPGLYFVSAGFALLAGGDVLSGLFLAIALFAAAGGLGMFFLVERRFGTAAGLVAALLHAALPYRAFEIYASGLYSAFAAACLLPWAWLVLARLAEDGAERRWKLAWPLVFAAVCLVNLPSAILLTYFVVLWLAIEIARTRRAKILLPVVAGGALGALVAGIYLLPAALELRFIVVPENARSHFESNFLFQGSASWMRPGLRSVFDRMGLFPALTAAVALLALLSGRRGRAPEAAESAWVRLLAAAAAASLFLATPLSSLGWKFLPVLHEVNLPWRLLEPLGAAAAALSAAAAVSLSRRRDAPRLSRVAGLVVLGALFLLCGVLAESVSVMNGSFPAAVARDSIERFAHKEGYFLPKGARRASDLSGMPTVACDRPCRVRPQEWGPARRRLTVDTAGGTHLAITTYFFPGWSAHLEGGSSARLPVAAEPGTGRLLVAVPPGSHEIAIVFDGTPARTLGAVASALGVAVWLALRFGRSRARAAG